MSDPTKDKRKQSVHHRILKARQMGMNRLFRKVAEKIINDATLPPKETNEQA